MTVTPSGNNAALQIKSSFYWPHENTDTQTWLQLHLMIFHKGSQVHGQMVTGRSKKKKRKKGGGEWVESRLTEREAKKNSWDHSWASGEREKEVRKWGTRKRSIKTKALEPVLLNTTWQRQLLLLVTHRYTNASDLLTPSYPWKKSAKGHSSIFYSLFLHGFHPLFFFFIQFKWFIVKSYPWLKLYR